MECGGKDVSGRGAHRQCIYQGTLVSHHRPQDQRKDVRGLMAHGGLTPESPLYSTSLGPDRGKPPGAPQQRAKLPEVAETQAEKLHFSPLKQSAFTGLGTQDRLTVRDLHLHLWPKQTPRVQVGLNRPTDCSGVIASFTCSRLTHSRGQGGRRQQTGCVTQHA